MIDQSTSESSLPALRIKESGDIFNALVSPDFGIRVSIARAIAANPRKAVSYGSFNGMSLVDYLIHLLGINQDTSYMPVLLAALAVFRDHRIPGIFMHAMERSSDSETITIASSRLAAENNENVRRFMSGMLWRKTTSPHARMVSNIMCDYDDLKPEESVRIAVITDAPFEVPPVNDSTLNAWLSELAGDSSEQAMVLIESLGENAFIRIVEERASLDSSIFKWLIKWSAADFPDYALTLIDEALECDDESLNIEALKALTASGVEKKFRKKIIRFLKHENPELFKAAIDSGIPLNGISTMLFSCENKKIRLALITRLNEERGHVSVLVKLLYDESWEIRAAAVKGLIAAGKPGIKAAKELVNNSDDRIRAAAIQVLAASGDLDLAADIIKKSRSKDNTDN